MRVRTVAAVLLTVLLAAGCSGAGGDPNGTSGASSTAPVSSSQPFTILAPDISASSPPSSPTTSSTSASSTPSSAPVRSSASDTAHPTTTTTGPATSIKATTGHSSWAPPDYGSAKPAVDAYLKVIDALNKGLENPKHPPTTVIEKYSQGPGRSVMLGSIADEKAHGRAWRGSPPPSRVLVKTNKVKASPAEVVLSDCPRPSPTWLEYDVKTGRIVPQPKYDPPAPYEVRITMFKLKGTWVMTSFTVDGSKTCAR